MEMERIKIKNAIADGTYQQPAEKAAESSAIISGPMMLKFRTIKNKEFFIKVRATDTIADLKARIEE